MGAIKLKTGQTRIPRHWGLVGFATAGKSTFLAAMRQPLLVVDADQRFSEVLREGMDASLFSDNASDHSDPLAIARVFKEERFRGFGTVAVDSLTAILIPIIARGMAGNRAGAHKNRMSAFQEKAEAVRLIQSAITSCGADAVFIWHYESRRDQDAVVSVRQTLPKTEKEGLLRSMNAVIQIEKRDGRRFAKIMWARRAPQLRAEFEDVPGNYWKGIPEKIEAAILTAEQEQGGAKAADPVPVTVSCTDNGTGLD